MKYLILIILLMCGGCRVAWTDHGFFMGFLTDFKAQDSSLHCDPNNLDIYAGTINSETDDITVTTPYGIVGTD